MDRLAISGILKKHNVTEKQVFKLFRLNGEPMVIDGKVKMVVSNNQLIQYPLNTNDGFIKDTVKSLNEKETNDKTYREMHYEFVKLNEDIILSKNETMLYKYILDAIELKSRVKHFRIEYKEGSLYYEKLTRIIKGLMSLEEHASNKIDKMVMMRTSGKIIEE